MKKMFKKQDDDDNCILVENEQLPARDNTAINNDFENTMDNGGGFYENDIVFTPAALPMERNDDYDDRALLTNSTPIYITKAPPDPFNYTYCVFYLLGIATMTPWNFFITADDYWMYKFRNTTLNDTSPDVVAELTNMQKSFTCDLTLTASISGTTFLILNAIYGHNISLKLKMLGTLFIILVIFIITTAFVEINTDRWQEQFFLITLFTVIIINISSAVMSGALFGFAGLFPSDYMSAVVSGQALGGIFTALAYIVVLTLDVGPKITAFIYFIIGSILILLSIVTFAIMSRQSFYQYYIQGGDKVKILNETPSHINRQVDEGVLLEPNTCEVFGKIYVEAVGLCLLFATTLSVYPTVSVLMQSENYGNGSAWNDVYYMPVVNFLFFNSGDYFGRILAGFWEKPRKNAHTVLLLVLIRMLYIPFFLCSNTNLHQFLPTLIQKDLAFMIMMITFALSNGYLANILLIMTPRTVMQHEKEVASSIMAASLSCGLALGSMLSMVFVQLL